MLQKLRRPEDNLFPVQLDARKRYAGKLADECIIADTQHGRVFRHAQPAVAANFDYVDRHGVVEREQSERPRQSFQVFRDPAVILAPRLPLAAGRLDTLARRARLLQGSQISGSTVLAHAAMIVGKPDEMAKAALEKMLRRQPAHADIV